MTGPLVECVPNFSEGRDRRKVDAIASSVASVAGISVLDVTLDPDHNRSVITFAGPPDAVEEAAIRAVARAVESIDLNSQAGVHPRIGAADVVPFVPVRGISLQACAGLATIAGARIGAGVGRSAAVGDGARLGARCGCGGCCCASVGPGVGVARAASGTPVLKASSAPKAATSERRMPPD